jgi:thiol-disulfide isomerase/thioredoxin
LELETVSGSLPFAVGHTGPLSLRLWIDVETSIIRQVQYEMDGRSYSEYYHDVELDPVISADHFTFTPPAHAEEVLYLGEGRQYDDLIGQPAPDFSLEDVDAQPVRLADYKGQVVMVDFWGTWCPPCRTAMPKLAELNDEYADQGFALIGIACQDTKKKVQAYAKKNDIKLSLPLSDGQVQKRYSVSGYPSSFLVDKQGNVRYAYIGFADGMKDKFASHIEALLAE